MFTFSPEPIQSVSQLTHSIKRVLESEYRFVRIRGEISNLRTPYSGHSYFILKDGSAQIRTVLFKQQKRFIDLKLLDGQEVVCFGRVTVYEPRGEYQVIVDSVELFGAGLLQRDFEKLKISLEQKGYFSSERKKTLPEYPEKIIVISSPTGAAIQDFLKIGRQRKTSVQIQILPVPVQGKDAAQEMARALGLANNLPGIDVIVLCRGGGSVEDLWAFNEEVLAKAIYDSTVPVVTGVGHEIDLTIADLCADLRCPTPTAAAEAIIPQSESLRRQLKGLEQGLVKKIDHKLALLDQQLSHATRILGSMKNIIKDAKLRLQLRELYLVQSMTRSLEGKRNLLDQKVNRLKNQSPSTRIALQGKHLQHLTSQLRSMMKAILERKQMAFRQQATLLHGVSPLATLGRGYSIVRKLDEKNGSYRVISNSKQVEKGEGLQIMLHKGQLDCKVIKRL